MVDAREPADMRKKRHTSLLEQLMQGQSNRIKASAACHIYRLDLQH